MFKKILFVLLLLACLIAPAAAAGGSGTAASPYIIETAAELQSMQNNLAAYYKLANDINLQGVSFTPIGSNSSPFTGSFDGAGYTISNMVISSSTVSTGFFSCLGSGATIRDVTFADCTVSSTSSSVGTVFGRITMSAANHDTATIDNVDCVRCTVTGGSIVGTIGGLIYTAAVVDMRNCDVNFANVKSTSSNNVGAIVGAMDGAADLSLMSGSVKNSRIDSSISHVGAIMGNIRASSSANMNDVDIENCILEASDSLVGAIAGYIRESSSVIMNGVVVKNCIMKCYSNVGGLIGFVTTEANAVATNCIVSDSTIVARSNYAGGIAGRVSTPNTGIFSDCTVSGCTILANRYAAGICPAYS